MSKIICEICGTKYPETAEQCPICGNIRDGGEVPAAEPYMTDEDQEVLRPAVRGGRFSKSNVRKRNQNMPYQEVPEPKNNQRDEEEECEEFEPAEKSNTLLNIFLVIVILALLAVTAYIALEYVVPNLLPGEETVPTTVATQEPTEEPTEAITEEPTVPCDELFLDGTTVLLEWEGQEWLLNVEVSPVDTTDELVFASADENVVIVDKEGKLTAVGEGDTVVTITCGNVVVECAVACAFEPEETEAPTEEPTEEPTEPPTEEPTEAPTEPLKDVVLGVTKTDLTFRQVGQDYKMKLTCDLDNSEVTWISENEKIVTIDENGIVVRVGQGTTNIIAKYGDQEVKIIVRCP